MIKKKEGVLNRDVLKTPSDLPKLQVRANACLKGESIDMHVMCQTAGQAIEYSIQPDFQEMAPQGPVCDLTD